MAANRRAMTLGRLPRFSAVEWCENSDAIHLSPIAICFPGMWLSSRCSSNLEREVWLDHGSSVNRQFPSVNRAWDRAEAEIIWVQMMRKDLRRYAIAFVAWLPFFALWALFAMTYAHFRL